MMFTSILSVLLVMAIGIGVFVAASKFRNAACGLSPEDRERYLARLAFSMETRELFRNSELTLDALALAVALTPHEVAGLIFDEYRLGFQDYVDRYRVEALKSALLCPKNAGETVVDIAMASGFSSKRALNRAFRKHTGMSPAEFRKRGGAGVKHGPLAAN